MHPDEVATDTDLVRRLVAAQLPQWAHLPVAPVPSAGTDNALYLLGDRLVVRLPRIHWARDDVAKEQRWLPVLAPHLPVAVPVPVAQGAPGEGYPWAWSVYRWLDGQTPARGATYDDDVLARDLAGFVAALQQVDVTGAPPASRGVPLVQRDAATRAALAAVADEVDVTAAAAVWEDALAAPPWDAAPRWVHGDLAPGNLLLTGGRLTAVIDFGACGVGDPACDLVVAWNLLRPGARDAYRAALDVDDATWRRGRGWALSIALIQLPYYRDTDPPLADSSRQVLRALL